MPNMRLYGGGSDLLSRLMSSKKIWTMERPATTGISTWIARSLVAQLMAPGEYLEFQHWPCES
jgi:hypothetical protein